MYRYIVFIFLIFTWCFSAFAQESQDNPKPFGIWLQEFKQEALTQGISQATLDNAFASTQPIERVIELDRKQPESVLTLEQYLDRAVNDNRVKIGRERLAENQELIQEIGDRYGVQPRFIVALWGIETSYGANTGGFDTIDALATLAYDGRRSEYFRGELIKALRILDEEHITAADMQGSWAGALGQCQFMPSSFLQYAIDYDQDGKRDIWETSADIFASIANYLKSSGWQGEEGWGKRVQLPKKFDRNLINIKEEKTLIEWDHLGIRKADGSKLPEKETKASLILVGENEDAVPYLVYGNYKVLLKWNRSRYFATAVGTLADRIRQ